MDKNFIKKYALRRVSEILGFEKIDRHEGSSFNLDCSFYKTNIENVIITDYDIRNDDDLEKKDCYMLIFEKEGFKSTKILSGFVLADFKALANVAGFFKEESMELFSKRNTLVMSQDKLDFTKQFFLFSYSEFYPSGGLSDVIATYDTIEAAKDEIINGKIEFSSNECYVWDKISGEIVFDFYD